MGKPFTKETVIAVIKKMGVFQINPLSYRNTKKLKILKRMTKAGEVTREISTPSVHNYFMASGD